MRYALTIAAVLAAIATGAAAGAAALKDPTSLVLRKIDFPPGASVTNRSGPVVSRAGSGYAVTFRYRTAGEPNELTSSASVFKSRALATAQYRDAKNEVGSAVARLQLPKYGDEQIATYHPLDGGRLIVRKKAVVWMIELQSMVGTRELSTSEAVAELKRYGAKQMRRVGSG